VTTRTLLLLIAAFTIVSRAIWWPDHPPNFDFANFALGVERFDPEAHQPHPPGYPLVILLARLFGAAGLSAVQALQWTSLAGTLAAILGAYRCGRRWGGEAGGLLAAALLAVEPVFWYSGVSSPTRVYLAAGVCWLLDVLAEAASGRPRALWRAAALLALFAGFRPELLLLFVAPTVVAARRGGLGWRRAVLAAALCLALCAPWIAWLAASFGSPFRLAYVYYHYFLHHASTTSGMLGAPQSAWRGMLLDALWWNMIPAAAALAALLLARSRPDGAWLGPAAAYFLPAIAIQLGVHLGVDSPDHGLGTITVLCVLAGGALGTVLPGRRLAALLAAAAMCSISLAPPGRLPAELGLLSLRSFAAQQRALGRSLAGLRAALEPDDAILVLTDSPLSGRVLEHELPGHIVLAPDAALGEAAAGGWRFHQRRQTPLDPEGIPLPASQRLVILSGANSRQRKAAFEALCSRDCQAREEALLVDLSRRPGRLDLPPYRLVVGSRSP